MKKRRLPHQKLKIRSVAVFANPDKAKAIRELPKLKTWLKKRRIAVLTTTQLSKADALIVLGGDGTILSIAPEAARHGVPVLGINMGHLGFLTAVQIENMMKALESWLAGHWTLSERTMLEVRAPQEKKPIYALNDAVIRLKALTRVTTVQASIDGESLGQFTGDGVIVATTTGSTAYSLSAQGPVVHPEVEAMLLTPICAHSFAQKPVVFPLHCQLELRSMDKSRRSEVQLCLDGQRVFPIRGGGLCPYTTVPV